MFGDEVLDQTAEQYISLMKRCNLPCPGENALHTQTTTVENTISISTISINITSHNLIMAY